MRLSLNAWGLMQNKHDSLVFLTLFLISSKDQQRAGSNEV